MLTPKPSHLVERIAERLLSSGALGGSAAQLLEPVQHPAVAPAAGADAKPAAATGGGQLHAPPATPLEAAPPRGPALSTQAASIQALSTQASIGAGSMLPAASQPPRVIPGEACPCESGGPGTTDSGDGGCKVVRPGAKPGDDTGEGARKVALELAPMAPAPRAAPATALASPSGAPAAHGPPRTAEPAIVAARDAIAAPSSDVAGTPDPSAQPASDQATGRRAPPPPPSSAALRLPARPGPGPRAPGADAPVDRPASRTVDAAALERAGMVDWSRTRSRISEEFRLVQRQILRAAFGPEAQPGFSNLLMVTSARPGEGKSFMSLNMAGSIGRQGDNHVLLIDADSKRDSICYSLGLAQARGLTDLAADPLLDTQLDPGPLIVRSPIERLSILPVGRERGADLFSTKEMTRLIQSLGRRYADRLLILDAPPCLSTSDPAVLAQVVGQILFVVEAERTQREEVEASLDLVQACPTITLVLNKQKVSSRYTFGAYSSYYGS